MMVKTIKIAVIGAGIIGLSSAVRLLENTQEFDKNTRCKIEVTILSDKFTPNTTGDVSGGFIQPYLVSKEQTDDIAKWTLETVRFLEELYQNPESGLIGVFQMSGYNVETTGFNQLEELTKGLRPLTSEELQSLIDPNTGKPFKEGLFFTTYGVECRMFLPYLTKRFEAHGGKIKQRSIKSFEELANAYDLIVNCAGIQAKSLANDSEMYPLRGQVIRVKAPWIKHFLAGDDYYILPNVDCIVLGGTHQKDNWNLNTNGQDTKSIWEGCTTIIPSLKNAHILEHNVGLRPGRNKVRVEKMLLKTSHGTEMTVIHNYGHGGSGVTLCWGCAKEVVNLVSNHLASL